jgi:hypothetical protein
MQGSQKATEELYFNDDSINKIQRIIYNCTKNNSDPTDVVNALLDAGFVLRERVKEKNEIH